MTGRRARLSTRRPARQARAAAGKPWPRVGQLVVLVAEGAWPSATSPRPLPQPTPKDVIFLSFYCQLVAFNESNLKLTSTRMEGSVTSSMPIVTLQRVGSQGGRLSRNEAQAVRRPVEDAVAHSPAAQQQRSSSGTSRWRRCVASRALPQGHPPKAAGLRPAALPPNWPNCSPTQLTGAARRPTRRGCRRSRPPVRLPRGAGPARPARAQWPPGEKGEQEGCASGLVQGCGGMGRVTQQQRQHCHAHTYARQQCPVSPLANAPLIPPEGRAARCRAADAAGRSSAGTPGR